MSRPLHPIALHMCLLLLLAAALAACRQPAMPAPAPAPAGTEAGAATALGEALSAAQLAGTSWQAVAFGGAGNAKPVDPATSLTLNFGAERYLGSGGCNWFLGVYEVAGDNMELNAPSQTVLQCSEPPNIMQQESMYLSALWNIDEYRKLDDQLLAYATGNQLLLTFRAAAPPPLEGATWWLKFQLADGQLTPVVPDTSVTATFADDGISGSGGCNRYQGAYTLDGDTLTINVPPHTLMKCGGPDGVIEQEQIFLANLAVTTRLVQTGDVLQLLNAEGETVLAFGAQFP